MPNNRRPFDSILLEYAPSGGRWDTVEAQQTPLEHKGTSTNPVQGPEVHGVRRFEPVASPGAPWVRLITMHHSKHHANTFVLILRN